MLSGHLRETIMRVYDTNPITAESIMCIAETVNSVAKMEYLRGRKDQSEERSQWIPCSERLPEVNGHYLVTIESRSTDSKKRFISIAVRHSMGWLNDENIIAWQPLPEPYKESENG